LLAGALGVVAWHQDWIGPREPAASPSTPGPSESSSAPFASTAPASAPSVDEPIASADPADARAELDEVLVPGGDVWVGCHAGDPGCSASADAEVRVQPFFITRHEVRVIDYGRCVVAKACNGKNLQLAGDSAHPEIASAQCNWNQPGHESQPMTCVSYTQAESYCRWSDARMPTEAEWIRAARGDDRRRFPWGDEAASCERTVMRDDAGRACGGDGSWNVETKREDVSPYAVLDLGGNVREWVSNWFDADRSRTVGSERVVKGGSWADDVDELRIGARRGLRPTERSIRVGFRCARPAVR
jgi:serine/threonine-protein kinase